MANTRTLTDHDEIRDWAAARAGQPALSESMPGMSESQPLLHFIFGQHAYQDVDQGPDRVDGLSIIEWDEWFRLFDERNLALVVNEDVAGQREDFHEFIRRPD